MAEFTPRDPSTRDRTPRTYGTEPVRPIDAMDMPDGCTVIEQGNYIEPRHNTFIVSVATMVLTSLILFWAPLFNSMLGGVFGGFHARTWGRALGAALLNSLVVPAIILGAYGFDQPDLLRFFYGLGIDGWVILHVVGSFVGAVCGVLSRPLVDRHRTLVHVQATPTTRGTRVTDNRTYDSAEVRARSRVTERRDV